jgi:hypothetical protein
VLIQSKHIQKNYGNLKQNQVHPQYGSRFSSRILCFPPIFSLKLVFSVSFSLVMELHTKIFIKEINLVKVSHVLFLQQNIKRSNKYCVILKHIMSPKPTDTSPHFYTYGQKCIKRQLKEQSSIGKFQIKIISSTNLSPICHNFKNERLVKISISGASSLHIY